MKRFFLLTLLASGCCLHAQTIGNSPYAAFGIGDVKYDNTVENSAMGGISTAYIWDFNGGFNFKNPAANQNVELTTLKIEGTNENNFFKSNYNNLSATKHSTYLSNISLSFPISKKVKFGLGYQPYSTKDYSLYTNNTLSAGNVKGTNFTGNGTINMVQTAASYSVSPEFSLGLRANYYFGNIYNIEELAYNNAELINGYETKNKVKSFNFTLGTTYQKKYKDDRKLTLGATASFGTTGTMETNYTNSTYYYVDQTTKSYISIIEQKNSSDKNLIPTEASVGVGYGHDTKWFLSTQLDYRKGENIQFLGKSFSFNNSYRISAGGWYLPNYNNFRNYFSRVVYRYGFYYEKGNLNLNGLGEVNGVGGKDINKFALTAGVTLPFQKSNVSRMSGIDLGIEFGKRGTLQNNLINQNFINLSIGLNFADKWFVKRQFD